MNCLQSFTFESSRDKHYEYCKNNEALRVEMPKSGSLIEFYDGQNQFKVPFMMCVDFEAILKPIQGSSPDPSEPYTKKVSQHIPSGFCIYSKFAFGEVLGPHSAEVKDPLKLYRSKDCIEKFCNHIKEKAKRLYHMFPEKPMDLLTNEQWRERVSVTFVLNHLALGKRSLPLRWQIQRSCPQELQLKV